MKRTFLSFAVTAVFLLIATLVPAEEVTTWGQLKQQTSETALAPAAKAVHSTSPLFILRPPPPNPTVEGASATLVRNKNGATLNLQTFGLTPGYTYTVWAIVFEEPDECVGEEINGTLCAEDDLFGPADVTIFGPVGGGLAGGNGQATFAAHMQKGASDYNDNLLGDGSLDNPTTAELHFAVRCHGPAIPGQIAEQIGSFDGGCDTNVCEDVQFAILKP